MMAEMPIAFGLTMVVCLALFSYCWHIRKLRNRFTSVHVSATPNEVQEQTGIKKEVINAFPTVTTRELKVDKKDELQCPICLIEYEGAEVLRKLPHCGHVFHIHCVDTWLEDQVTCPVCRIVLTKAIKFSPDTNRQQSLQTAYCRGPSMIPSSVTVEVAPGTPGWVSVNRPMPLPSADPEFTALDSPSTSETNEFDIELQHSENTGFVGESPILEPHIQGWGAIYLQRSFSFGISHLNFHDVAQNLRSSTEYSGSLWRIDSRKSHASRRSRSVTWELNQPITEHWHTDFGCSAEEVYESKVVDHLPLTISPEHCSFEFLPIVTGPGGDYSLRPPKALDDRLRVG